MFRTQYVLRMHMPMYGVLEYIQGLGTGHLPKLPSVRNIYLMVGPEASNPAGSYGNYVPARHAGSRSGDQR